MSPSLRLTLCTSRHLLGVQFKQA